MAVQAKLTVSPPDDRYEQEADRVAEAVVRPPGTATEEPAGAGLTPLSPRAAAEPDEASDEETEEEDDAPEEVQAHRPGTPAPPDVPDGFATRLAQAEPGGRPLPSELRTSMERAFGASFQDVRTHADAGAATLSRSIGASAFTHGTHIYLGAGRFDPDGTEGRRLLAHELTHVVQQNPGLAAGQTAAPARGLQRQPKQPAEEAPAKRHSVALFLFGADRKPLRKHVNVTIAELTGLEPGVYDAALTEDTITVGGREIEYSFTTPELAAEIKKLLPQARSVKVYVYDLAAKPDESKTEETGAPGSAEAGKEAGEAEPGSGGKGTEAGAGGGEGAEAGASGGSGSKYGFLGLIHPPKWISRALDKMIEGLGFDKEILEIRALLTALKDLWEHRTELGSLFTTEKLLGVLFGIEGGDAIDALGKWANKTTRHVTRGTQKGIAAVAAKLAKILEVVRKILRPVFAARNAFMVVIAGFANILERVPLVEALFAAPPDERGTKQFDQMLGSVVDNIGEEVTGALEGVRKGVALTAERLEEKNYVTYDEVARAVAAVAEKFMPKPARVIAWLTEKVGVDLVDKVATHIIAPLIPKAALEEINGAIRGVMSVLEPVIKAVTGLIDEVLAGIQNEVHDVLAPELKELFAQLSPIDGAGQRGPTHVAPAARAMAGSSGRPLPEDVRDDLGAELGADLSDVRVHADSDAASAASTLEAKAFTVGRNVYFGSARYAPGTVEGRRLLAHELTHVVQQSEGAVGEVVQRDAKSAAKKKLGGSVAKVVIGAAKALVQTAPKTKKRGAEITKWVKDRLIGRKVVSERNPALPEAYYYVTNKAGLPVNIRRKFAFVRVVPKLTISRAGRIREASSVNPITLWKNGQRRALRRALAGCSSDVQAHHVIPLELWGPFGVGGHVVVVAAVKLGFRFNGVENGICLSEDVHEGSHPRYTIRVLKSLDAYLGLTPAEQLAGARVVAKGYKQRLAGRTEKLD